MKERSNQFTKANSHCAPAVASDLDSEVAFSQPTAGADSSRSSLAIVFSARLAALRESIGVTQAVVANATGVSASSIGYYEKGLKLPSAETLARFCRYFHVPADYFLGFTDDAGPALLPDGSIRDEANRLLAAADGIIASESRAEYKRNVLGPVADILERIGGLIYDADESFANLQKKYPKFSRGDPYGSMGADIKSLTEAMLGLSNMGNDLKQFLAEYRERCLDVTKAADTDAFYVQQRIEVAICKALTGGFTEMIEEVKGGGNSGDSSEKGR